MKRTKAQGKSRAVPENGKKASCCRRMRPRGGGDRHLGEGGDTSADMRATCRWRDVDLLGTLKIHQEVGEFQGIIAE